MLCGRLLLPWFTPARRVPARLLGPPDRLALRLQRPMTQRLDDLPRPRERLDDERDRHVAEAVVADRLPGAQVVVLHRVDGERRAVRLLSRPPDIGAARPRVVRPGKRTRKYAGTSGLPT